MTNKQIFSLRQIQAACVIGSPIVAGVLVAINYRKFGKFPKGLLSIILGIVWTALLITIGSFIPEHLVSSTGFVVTFINGAIAYQIVKKLQGKEIEEHFEENGNKGSNWVVGGMIIGVIALFAIPMILFENLSQIENYDRQPFDRNGIYYNQEMNIEEVNKLGGILTRIDYFNSESEGEVIFISQDSIYELKLIVDNEAAADSSFIVYIKELCNHINGYQFRKPFSFFTTDVYLKNQKIIELNENEEYASLAEIEVFSSNPNFVLFYHRKFDNVEREKFQKLILEMRNFFPPQNKIDFFVDFENEAFCLRLFIPKQNWNQPQLKTEAKYFKDKLNNYGFKFPFKLILADNFTLDYEEQQIE